MNGNKTTAISAERRTQRGISVLAFFVPAFIMLVLFIIRGIYPFGDRSFLFSDMYHQYMPFLSEFVHKIKAGEGLSYSYNVGIGSNFLALYVYYVASPFNWLVFLLPESLIMEFMSYLVILRIGLMGLTFSIYLRKTFGKADPAVILFSTCYALSGYLAAYNWNVMWLDCLILLPLILLGAERLAREGRWVMYTVTLGLCILTNYYISIMICIFLVLYFGMLLITEYYTMTEGQSQKVKTVFCRIGRFAFASLLAGGLAAALLIPEVCAILRTDFGNSDFPATLESYFSVFDMLARHCLCVTTERGLEHWPNIYCGVAVFLLVPMYALNEKISVRKRFCNLALAGFLLLSFGTNVLDFLWHGLNYPDSLPARQSFLYIFLILVMCYDAFRNVEGTSPRQIIYGYLAAVIFLLACEKFVESEAAKVVVIGPCIAEKEKNRVVKPDAVLTFEDLKQWLSEEQIEIEACEEEPFEDREPGANLRYPVSGGLLTAVTATQKKPDKYRKFYVSGVKDCLDVCEAMKTGEVAGCFIEMNACHGGCVNGPSTATSVSSFKVKLDLEAMLPKEPADLSLMHEAARQVEIHRTFADRSQKERIPTEEEIREILKKTGKMTPEQELNCGACGYPTCREKAIAVFQKKAEVDMCIPYLHDRAQSLSHLVMDTSPNLIMIIDDDMRIQECSVAAEMYFGVKPEAIKGKPLEDFINAEDVREVFRKHTSVHSRKVIYPDRNLVTLQNIAYIDDGNFVIATIIDVTREEKQAKQEYAKKKATIDLAQNVIYKQMMVAQNIAGLLGETTAETKTTLMKLCSLIDDESESEVR